jgi:surfeit locus 1 family protein
MARRSCDHSLADPAYLSLAGCLHLGGRRELEDLPSFRMAMRAASRFRPGLWPTLAASAGLLVLLGLGTWQVERLQWKESVIAERQARLAAPPEPLPSEAEDWRAFDFRRVQASGAFRHDLEQLFGASAIHGRLGHHVLTPLLRADGPAVLVDRGWVPADKAHPAARRAGQVEGEVRLTGIARYRGSDRSGWFTPDNQPRARLWFRYDLPALEEAIGLELLPVVVEADASAQSGGLPIGGRTRVELPNNHLQYALTWYGLAAVLAAVYVAFGMQRHEERR